MGTGAPVTARRRALRSGGAAVRRRALGFEAAQQPPAGQTTTQRPDRDATKSVIANSGVRPAARPSTKATRAGVAARTPRQQPAHDVPPGPASNTTHHALFRPREEECEAEREEARRRVERHLRVGRDALEGVHAEERSDEVQQREKAGAARQRLRDAELPRRVGHQHRDVEEDERRGNRYRHASRCASRSAAAVVGEEEPIDAQVPAGEMFDDREQSDERAQAREDAQRGITP